MKVNEQWLREWVNPQENIRQLAELLTMAGLEVEAVEPVSESLLEKVVVGQVSSIGAHPNADKLQVCQVDVGAEKPLQIVCGAANVAVGGQYPVAQVGAVLPSGLKIKSAKLRGEASAGMLCSTAELGLTESASGLYSLPTDATIGMPIYDYLKLDDTELEIGLTPNRGDCLSIMGIAREIGVLSSADFNAPDIPTVKASIKDTLPITLKAEKACAHYVGRIIKGVNLNTDSPIWLQEKLRRCGLRSISPIVDVTNYVLLELGQPMHAFDLQKMTEGIVVRYAKKEESISLLDGQEIKLSDDCLVIADKNKPIALAGIMGGAESAVSDETQDILLESAFFDPLCIAGKARYFGLHTDSSHRFERGVDPSLQVKAIHRATQLIQDIVGGKAGPLIEKTANKYLPVRKAVNFRYQRIQRVLGVEIPQAKVDNTFKSLGFSIKAKSAGCLVTAPGFRFDIEQEVDLIEEVARIFGYHNIPATYPQLQAKPKPIPEGQVGENELKSVLVNRGYQEAVTYSFVDPKLQAQIDPDLPAVPLQNPISADMSVMRTSLLPGLLQAALYNHNRQQNRIRLFESGLVFIPQKKQTLQIPRIAGLVMGHVSSEQWAQQDHKADFFDAKSDVEALLNLTGHCSQFEYRVVDGKEQHPALHPGQAAQVYFTDNKGKEHVVGWLGSLYPALQKQLGFSDRVIVFELDLALISTRGVPVFEALSKFPAIRRDLAIVVGEQVTLQNIWKCVRKSSPDMLKDLQLFDEYRGKGIDSGRKSLAFSIILQNQDRTLTDGEVDTIIARVVESLEDELGATLRE